MSDTLVTKRWHITDPEVIRSIERVAAETPQPRAIHWAVTWGLPFKVPPSAIKVLRGD